MATSGTYIYQIGRDAIITSALRKLGVVASGQTPSSDDIDSGAMALNMLVAELRTIGMPLWARKEYTLPTLVAGTASYEIGIGKTFNTAYPVHLLQAFRQDGSNTTKIYMEIIPNFNFNLYPTSSGGTPIQINYQPLVNYGKINIWPVPDANAVANSDITIIYQAPFQYFDAAADTMDFPEEWYLAVVYKLAVLLAPEWGIPLADRQLLNKEAEMHVQMAKEVGYEDGSLFIQPFRRDQ